MIERLFGIEALKDYFNMSLSVHNVGLGSHKENWINKNIQPKRKISKSEKLIRGESEYGICPHYELIELCADIMGVKPDELVRFDYFCGLLVERIYIHEPRLFPSRKCGTTLIPFRCCAVIKDLMNLAIKLAKSKKPVPIEKISDSPSKEETEKINKFLQANEEFRTGQKVLENWKETIPKNIGTRSIKYSKIALISAVEKLAKQLEKEAIGKDNILAFNAPCPLAPKYEHGYGL